MQAIRLSDLLRIRGAYRELKNTPMGQRVLRDLAGRCYAVKTTASDDPYEQARKEGRRQVWLYIQSMIRATDEELEQLIKGENQ